LGPAGSETATFCSLTVTCNKSKCKAFNIDQIDKPEKYRAAAAIEETFRVKLPVIIEGEQEMLGETSTGTPPPINYDPRSTKPKIAVCIPHTGMVATEFAAYTLAALAAKSEWCERTVLLSRGYNVAMQRNDLAGRALKWGATHVFFIDSDMLFNGDPDFELKQLYNMNQSITSGITRVKDNNGFPYSVFAENPPGSQKYEHIEPKNLMFYADAVGGYCMLVKREVFEKLPQPWFVYDKLPEDFYFCQNARKAGFKIMVNATVKLDHMGMFTLQADGKFRW
jgi:hypothetical protein